MIVLTMFRMVLRMFSSNGTMHGGIAKVIFNLVSLGICMCIVLVNI